MKATEKDVAILAYAAGIIDGEGCITYASRRVGNVIPQLVVANTNFELVAWLQHWFGGAIYDNGKSKQREKVAYRWNPNTNLKEFLSLIIPYMVLKNVQAFYALELIQMRRSTAFIDRKRRLEIRDELSKLNKKGNW